jgi:transposase
MGAMDRLPDDIETLRAIAVAALARADIAEAEAARAVAEVSALEAQLLAARLEAEKLRRDLYGQRSERAVRLLDQFELAFEEAEATASEDELAAELAAAKTTTVQAFTRARPSRKPFPEHLPRERIVSSRDRSPAPAADRRSSRSSARRSPRRWRAFRASGR